MTAAFMGWSHMAMISPIAIGLVLLFWCALLATCAYAWRFGGAPERIAAVALAAAAGLSVLVKPDATQAYTHVELGTLAVDLLLLGLLVGLSFRTKRNWPIWASGFHLASVATHIAMAFDTGALPPAYALVQGFWAYPVLISLVAGTRGCRRRRMVDDGIARS